jgi:hypothetical protein
MINKYVLIIIGAGGTGTYFLKEFSRFIAGTEYEKKFMAKGNPIYFIQTKFKK